MKIATRLNDKYTYGDKIVASITEEEYNELKKIRSENIHNSIHGFIVLNSTILKNIEYKDLFDSLNDKLKKAKKEFDNSKKAKEQKIKMI